MRNGKHTTVIRCPMFVVIAEFISSSVGGSMICDVFSSNDSKGSVPSFVTQGCSCYI